MPSNTPPLTEAELTALEFLAAVADRYLVRIRGPQLAALLAEVRAAREAAKDPVCYCVRCGNAYREGSPPLHGPPRP